MIKPYNTFRMEPSGRCGCIHCQSGENKIAMGWEISGVDEYDILLAPLDLKEWDEPKGIIIPLDKQIEILNDLRDWLKDQKIRTDIDLPTPLEFDKGPCLWVECKGIRIKDSAYCIRHFDEILLRQ